VELKIKKRIVGFILLIALALMLVPLLFGRSVVASDELKLSSHIPEPPIESAALDLPPPAKEETIAKVKPIPVPQSTPSSRIVFEQLPVSSSGPPMPEQRGKGPSPAVDTGPSSSSAQVTAKSIEEESSALLSTQPPIAVPQSASPDKTDALPLPSSIITAPKLAAEKIASEPPISAPKPTPQKATPAEKAAPPKPVVQKATPPMTTTSPKPTQKATPEAWVVQMGSFSDKANAEALVKKIQAAGFPAYLTSIKTDTGKSWIKVFVGPEILKSAADKTKTKLAQSLNINGIVVKAGE
jgi:DedD protein